MLFNEYVFLMFQIAKNNDIDGEIGEPWVVNEGFMKCIQLCNWKGLFVERNGVQQI